MYCPVCFNDTLKIATSGVVKLTFNGKAKPTSQFFYNLTKEKQVETDLKLEEVIRDYSNYYTSFQNKDMINDFQAFSIDFKCENKCVVDVNHRLNVVDLVFKKETFKKILIRLGKEYELKIDTKTI